MLGLHYKDYESDSYPVSPRRTCFWTSFKPTRIFFFSAAETNESTFMAHIINRLFTSKSYKVFHGFKLNNDNSIPAFDLHAEDTFKNVPLSIKAYIVSFVIDFIIDQQFLTVSNKCR